MIIWISVTPLGNYSFFTMAIVHIIGMDLWENEYDYILV
jgi:hypothetical protein